MVRIGGWLFRQRSWLPAPIAVLLLAVPAPAGAPAALVWAGAALVALGEAVRLWAVHHIGVISRTRSDRLGPLIDSGPFARVRNPLYLGNLAIWAGFAVSARLLWVLPAVLLLLAFEYHAIVRWEESLLESRLGAAYTEYAARVRRWLPLRHGGQTHRAPARLSGSSGHRWGDTLFSERGTLIAIAAGYALLWLKAQA